MKLYFKLFLICFAIVTSASSLLRGVDAVNQIVSNSFQLTPGEAVDCTVRVGAYDYAKKIIPDYGELYSVFLSLNLEECGLKSPKEDPHISIPEKEWDVEGTTLYVDDKTGNDTNNGSFESPFKTIQYAVKASRFIEGKKVIYVREGEYYFSKSMVLTPLDSDLTISAYKNEIVSITGSKTIKADWKPYKTNEFEVFNGMNAGYTIHTTGSKTPGSSIPGKMTYMNKTTTYEQCQEICQKDSTCNAYFWHESSVTGGWANMCYSILDSEFITVTDPGHVSGIKLNIYSLDLSNESITTFDQLFINNKRQIRARYPNGNPEYMGGYTDPSGYMESGQATWGPTRQFNASYEYHISEPSIPNALYNQYAIGEGGVASLWNPPTSYWALKKPVGGGGCTYTIPTSITIKEKQWSPRKYNHPEGAIIIFYYIFYSIYLHAFHSGEWGNWMFEVDSAQTNNGDITLHWTKGGFQEARGNSKGGKFFIENVFEELDSPNEWFFDTTTKQLYFYPNGTIDQYQSIQIPTTKRLIEIRGTGHYPVKNISIRGITFKNTDTTYMDVYEVPSGGDISVHRGGSLFIEGTENVSILYNTFINIGSNGICLSNYNYKTTLYFNDISLTGDSGILLLGDTQLVDATQKEHNEYINIEHNIIHETGLYMKQSSPIMIARSMTTIQKNILFNCPRAGININDGLGGGHDIYNNVMYNTVRETSDHGVINTWDRLPYTSLYKDNTPSMYPKMNTIHHNYLISNYHSLWPIDHDDGSCYWNDTYNVLAYGGWKNFLGHSKSASYNLYIYPDSKLAKSIKPFCALSHGAVLNSSGWDEAYTHNRCIIESATIYAMNKGKTDPRINELNPASNNNIIYTPHTVDELKVDCNYSGYYTSIKDYQELGFDKDITVKPLPTNEQIDQWMRELLEF
ncbi:hypothetical protein WA158_001944 [Blastocystis sp. Blastoise]